MMPCRVSRTLGLAIDLFQVDPNAAVEAECILTKRRTTRNREPRVTQTEVFLSGP